MKSMKQMTLIFCLVMSLMSCRNKMEADERRYLIREIPGDTPADFMPELIPDHALVHKGIFTPDLQEYYYTVSDKNFEQFDVYVIRKEEEKWSAPQKAFFNSDHSEHGMSFSPDGNTVYFGSTRHVPVAGVALTWHIWSSERIDGKWAVPTYVDIPNLRDKLVSHPILTHKGNLYFHAANIDYGK